MTTEERALRMLAEANPIPDEESIELDLGADRYFEILEQRGSQMTQLDTRRSQPDPKRSARRGLTAVALAAAAVVAAIFFVATEDQQVVGEPVDIAQAFIEARNGHDGEAMTALLAPDALIEGELVEGDPSRYPLLAEFERAVGMQYQVDDCIETTAADTVRLLCIYLLESSWSQAVGLEPIPVNSFRFNIVDGRIQYLLNNLNFNALAPVQSAFSDWLESNHPDEVERMFRPDDVGVPRPVMTPEAIELFDRYTAEFVTEMSGAGGS